MPRHRSGRGLSSLSNYILPAACAGAMCYPVPMAARADTIGLSQLHAIQPGLNGGGIRVAQVEAPEGAGVFPPDFEVSPTGVNVNVSPSLFTYYSTNGVSTTFNDAVGSESFHADAVASQFYGLPFGVATNVAHVDNYEAGFFIQHSYGRWWDDGGAGDQFEFLGRQQPGTTDSGHRNRSGIRQLRRQQPHKDLYLRRR